MEATPQVVLFMLWGDMVMHEEGACVSSRAGSSNERGAQITVGEGSNSPSDKQPGRFLLKPLLGAQEERSDEASNQPETVERVGDHITFQNGRGPNPEGHPTIGGLVREGR